MRTLAYGLLLMLSAVAAGTFAQEVTRDRFAPRLTGITSDTCLLPGQRIRIGGKGLGSPRQYELRLFTGTQQWPLTIEQWQPDGIVAVLPQDIEGGSGRAVLALLERHSGQRLGNTIGVQLCPAGPQEAPVQAEPTGRSLPAPTSPPAPKTGGDANRLPSPAPRALDEPTRLQLPVERVGPPPLAGDAVEAGEVLAFSADMAAAKRLDSTLREKGYRIKRRRALRQLGLVISVIGLPDGVKVREALVQLRRLDNTLVIDANHRFRLMEKNLDSADEVYRLMGWSGPTTRCGDGLRIGLVDTPVDSRHPALPSDRIVVRSFLPLGVRQAPKRHATAIASLLVGRPAGNNGGLLPGATLYNAAVFRERQGQEPNTTAELIIAALDWLQGQNIDVINLSLAGEPNRLLEQAVRNLLQQNQLLVAAAGNGGPKAPPAYPAAWAGVVAVTAVDIRGLPYREANRGDYIDVAAPGVDIWAARPGGQWAYHSGTSFAVPFATAALALLRQQASDRSYNVLVERLRRDAKDLGEPGRDPVFGYGLLQIAGRCR